MHIDLASNISYGSFTCHARFKVPPLWQQKAGVFALQISTLSLHLPKTLLPTSIILW